MTDVTYARSCVRNSEDELNAAAWSSSDHGLNNGAIYCYSDRSAFLRPNSFVELLGKLTILWWNVLEVFTHVSHLSAILRCLFDLYCTKCTVMGLCSRLY